MTSSRQRPRLAAVDLQHGPTIGDMYEGLSKDLLGRVLPEGLGLQLVKGFVTDGQGGVSGQIDCMLVRGAGERLPYTDAYRWHVKDVIAVFEIKKTLYGKDLADAFAQLREVRDLETSYFASLRDSEDRLDPRVWQTAQRVFAETTGLWVDRHEDVASLPLAEQHIFNVLLPEMVGAVRVVLGYDGYKSERAFRESLVSQLETAVTGEGKGAGFGPRSFPQLIVSGRFSLCKMNGQPYSAPLYEGKWPFLMSASVNPLLLVLEYVWTRLARDYNLGGLWGDDLEIEDLNPYLLGRPDQTDDGRVGWHLEYVPTSEAALRERSKPVAWTPQFLTHEQFVAVSRLSSGGTVRLDDPDLVGWLADAGLDVDDFVRGLVDTRLVAVRDNELRLATTECMCVILPTGYFVAADNNTGRLTRWLARAQPQ